MCCCHGHHCYGWWYWDEPYQRPPRFLRPVGEEDVTGRERPEFLESKIGRLERELEELKKQLSERRS